MMLLNKLDQALGARLKRQRRRVAEADAAQTAGMIGEHYDALHGGLDRLTELSEQLRAFEPLLDEMRRPLVAEFETRRADFSELVGLRTAYADARERVEELERECADLTSALSQTEETRDEAVAQLSEQSALVQSTRLQADQLRTDLSHSQSEARGLTDGEKTLNKRIRQLEQDLKELKAKLEQTEAARAEAAIGRTRALRDVTLTTDENASLKKRAEELVAETTRLSRVETSLGAQLAAEKTRAAGEQAEAGRAIRLLEGRAETARGETAALQVRLDTLTVRADRLEQLNAETNAALVAAQAALIELERKHDASSVELERALERGRELETANAAAQERLTATETARLAAVDRADHLAKSVVANEKALARSEERLAKVQTFMAALKSESDVRVKALVEQVGSMRSNLEGARAESAMTAAALEGARARSAVVAPRAPVSVQH